MESLRCGGRGEINKTSSSSSSRFGVAHGRRYSRAYVDPFCCRCTLVPRPADLAPAAAPAKSASRSPVLRDLLELATCYAAYRSRRLLAPCLPASRSLHVLLAPWCAAGCRSPLAAWPAAARSWIWTCLIGEERPAAASPLMRCRCQLGLFYIYLIAEEGSVDYMIMRWPKFPVELISNS